MQSLRLYNKQDLRYEQAPYPEISKHDEVIIKVKATGICGSDISRYQKLGPYKEGTIFGHEFSGIVVETGKNVKTIKVGDRVAGCPTFYCDKCFYCLRGELSRCENLHVMGSLEPGSFAEYTKLPEKHLIKIPENVSFASAAMIEPSSVVLHGLYKTRLQPGSTVAVVGCGNIGLLAIQWAKIFGAKEIIAVDIDNRKLQTALLFGATAIVNAKNSSTHEKVANYTEGKGVDVAIESAGSAITSAQILALPKKGGEIIYLGIPYSDIQIERFYFEKIVRNELHIKGAWNALSSPYPGIEWKTTLNFMNLGILNTEAFITHKAELKEGPNIFNRLIKRTEAFGKVMFYP